MINILLKECVYSLKTHPSNINNLMIDHYHNLSVLTDTFATVLHVEETTVFAFYWCL